MGIGIAGGRGRAEERARAAQAEAGRRCAEAARRVDASLRRVARSARAASGALANDAVIRDGLARVREALRRAGHG